MLRLKDVPQLSCKIILTFFPAVCASQCAVSEQAAACVLIEGKSGRWPNFPSLPSYSYDSPPPQHEERLGPHFQENSLLHTAASSHKCEWSEGEHSCKEL